MISVATHGDEVTMLPDNTQSIGFDSHLSPFQEAGLLSSVSGIKVDPNHHDHTAYYVGMFFEHE